MTPTNLLEFYLNAYEKIIDEGFIGEIEWCQSRHFPSITAQDFGYEYTFAVLASSGLREQIVRKNYNKFLEAAHDGNNPYETINNKRQRAAIMHVWVNLDKILGTLQAQPTDEAKIEYLDTLPQIGPKAKKHLARNLGIDCVKPDRHMERLAERFGYESPDAMCLDIQRMLPVKERIGVIDVVLWRYCNLTGGN